jgi:hypothetical protein
MKLFSFLRKLVYDSGQALSRILFAHMVRNGLILGAYFVPEGSKYFFTETFQAVKAITALTNANPALATSAAHGYVDGAELLIKSGWEDAGDTIWRADVVDANSYRIENFDASDTNFFPPGGGTGTAQLAGPWTEIPQVLNITGSGGDPRYTTINPLTRRNGIQMPVGFNPSSIELTLGFDGSLPAMQAMKSISRRLGKVGFKMALSGGLTLYAYGTLALSDMPAQTSGQPITVRAAISVDGSQTSYYS